MSYNKITIVANIGQNATVQTVNGRNVLNFSAATSKSWVDAQNVKHQQSTWWGISQWGTRDFTKFAQYLTKGTQVLITGEVSARTYQNKQGQVEAQLQINADEIKLLGSNNNQNQPQNNGNSQEFNKMVEDTKDDAPF
jgi:single-strand DNA-binding protein